MSVSKYDSLLDYYMSLNYVPTIIEDTEDGGYAIKIEELPGCISCGNTIEEALCNIMDAKKEWLKAALEQGIHIPSPLPTLKTESMYYFIINNK